MINVILRKACKWPFFYENRWQEKLLKSANLHPTWPISALCSLSSDIANERATFYNAIFWVSVKYFCSVPNFLCTPESCLETNIDRKSIILSHVCLYVCVFVFHLWRSLISRDPWQPLLGLLSWLSKDITICLAGQIWWLRCDANISATINHMWLHIFILYKSGIGACMGFLNVLHILFRIWKYILVHKLRFK